VLGLERPARDLRRIVHGFDHASLSCHDILLAAL
jgi:hypothetical protein